MASEGRRAGGEEAPRQWGACGVRAGDVPVHMACTGRQFKLVKPLFLKKNMTTYDSRCVNFPKKEKARKCIPLLSAPTCGLWLVLRVASQGLNILLPPEPPETNRKDGHGSEA